jgi:amino acid adenylation domain-containing protein
MTNTTAGSLTPLGPIPDEVDSLPALFAHVARSHPRSLALVDGATRLTYEEVDAASDRLAASLARHGIATGDVVGVVADRSAQTAISILAALKAGAVYVPLDPSYPTGRLQHVIADSKITVVLGSADSIPSADPATVTFLDRTQHAPDHGADVSLLDSPDALPRLAGADSAYVIYTSGSTGYPKGCLVSHGNVLALLRSTLPLFRFTGEDVWTVFHSFGFDFSVWELWGAWATGAAAVIVPSMDAQSPDRFLDLLQRERVSVLNQVPSVFRYLAQSHEDAEKPPLRLRYLIFGGESIELDVIAGFVDGMYPRPVPVNMYGITEITVHATFKVLEPEDLTGSVTSPIGTPLPHLKIELRDEQLAPVAPNEPGEMWISGTGVCAGYLGQDELTAARFVDFGSADAPDVHYRSGDLARRLPNGELEYLGRNDEQVKLRGFRVELGEISAALRQHPDVQEAAVVVLDTVTGAQSLVACIVPGRSDTELDTRSLRKHAQSLLPAHMVPHRYQSLPALPLTSSGKLDRKTLTETVMSAGGAPQGRSSLAGHHQRTGQ